MASNSKVTTGIAEGPEKTKMRIEMLKLLKDTYRPQDDNEGIVEAYIQTLTEKIMQDLE